MADTGTFVGGFRKGGNWCQTEQWQAPLYWEVHDGQWMIRDFDGLHPAESKPDEPVSHVSFLRSFGLCQVGGQAFANRSRMGESAPASTLQTGNRRSFPWGDDPLGSIQSESLGK